MTIYVPSAGSRQPHAERQLGQASQPSLRQHNLHNNFLSAIVKILSHKILLMYRDPAERM
jgi:hypothetical protein